MRFDTFTELFILEDVQDGLGGHMQSERCIGTRYANIEELSLETTVKIYGDTLTQNAKAIFLGNVGKIDNVMYKVISRRKIKNKTSFFLEVDND